MPAHVYIHLQQDLTIDRQSFRQMLENSYFFMAQLDGCDCLYRGKWRKPWKRCTGEHPLKSGSMSIICWTHWLPLMGSKSR